MNNTFPFLVSSYLSYDTVSITFTQRHIKLSLETQKKGGAKKNLEKCLTLRIRHNGSSPERS